MILHVDMDAFYASVEQRDQPELRGKAVIVGGSPQRRGVVCAASYEARKFGVHSAMPSSRAVTLCPHGVFLPTRMEHYARVSEQIREVLDRYTPLVEPLSLDEAFLDVTASEALFGSAASIGRSIKRDIADELKLIASVGVAPNKFLAKIASDLDKPDGFVEVDGRRIREFLDPLPIGRLWGVGKVTGKVFERLGVRTVGDARRLPEEALRRRFGEQGEHLARLARGIDTRSVVPHRRAKSISHETTFAVDIDDQEILRAWIVDLGEQVAWRLRRHGLFGRTVQLKMRFADFQTITRSVKLRVATQTTQEICRAAVELFADRVSLGGRSIRLVGVGVSDLEDRRGKHQRMLFADESDQREQELDEAADSIRERFGRGSLGRASGMLAEKKGDADDESS